MSQVIGPDISFYQDEPTTPQGVDFAKMRAISNFVILRAGQNLWVDSRFKTYWSDSKKVDLPRGSYWFYDSRADPKKQAELWVQTLGSDLGELPLFADFEERYGGAFKGWQNWYVFLERLKTLVVGKEICIYTAPSYWRENAPNATAQKANLEYFHKYPLWIAHYRVEKPLIPKPWGENEWLFWQYTEKGDGKLYGVESLQIDLSHFNGSPEAFKTRFNLPDIKPIPVDEIHYRIDLSVRTGPAESSESLGNLVQAEVVTSLGTSEDKSWMQIRRESGLTGWVNSNAFVRIATPTPDPNPNPNPNPNPDPNPNPNPDPEPGTGRTYRVTTNSLRIRSGPGTTFEVVGALSKDDLVEEINSNSDKSWLKVRRKDALTGWSASEYLSTTLTPPTPKPQPEPLKVALFPGVTYVRDVRQVPRMLVIHVLSIDVTTPGLDFLVTPPGSAKIGDPLCARTTSKFLSEFAVQIAVNGDGFTYPNPNSFSCPAGQPPVLLNGFAASRGKTYSTLGKETTFFVGRSNKLSINAAPGEIIHAVSGDRPLVSLGRPVNGLDTSLLNPRTALGMTKDLHRLILMVVDGRQAGYSEGVNFVELAALLIYYGAQTGMNLDGGGSSTMVVEGPDKKPVVLNSPIDSSIIGQERAIANHLGIFIKK